jgi:predicted amidohydrolase
VGYYQNNPLFGEVTRNLDQIEMKLEQAETDLLVLPEFCASGYQFASQDEVRELSEPVPNGPTTTRLLDIAKKRRMVIVAGLPERAGSAYYNSAVVVSPSGSLAAIARPIFFRGDAVLHAGRHRVSGVGYRAGQDRGDDLFRLVLS